jgi:hypothetical protein
MSKPINIKNIKEIKDIKDANFSVYIETQTKQTPPSEDFLQQHIHKIYPKITNEWIDSDKVIKCQSCNVKFGWIFTRKHHCRACGCVFCHNCCDKYVDIPVDILDIPKENKLWRVKVKKIYKKISGTLEEEKSRVCNDCYSKITKLKNIEYIIHICEFLDIPELYNILRINKSWHNAGIHCLSKFRNIQYKQADYIYTRWECNILWNINKNLVTHNNWFLILIKSTLINSMLYSKNKIKELINLLKENNLKKKSCWQLMCSRKCNIELDIIDILDVIQYIAKIDGCNLKFWKDNEYIELILLLINKINNKTDYVDYIMPMLSISLRLLINNTNKYSEEFINKILDIICDNNEKLYCLLTLEFNYINNLKPSDENKERFCSIINNYLKTRLNSKTKNIIYKTINIIMEISYKRDSFNNSDGLPIIYPFNTNYLITDILEIREIQSASKPLLVRVYIQKNKYSKNNSDINLLNSCGKKVERRFLIKKDSQLRKENIVSSLIILLQNKLIQQCENKRIENFDPIPTYKIIMINHEIGLIEFVDNSITLRQIQKKKYTLQNYVLENNKDLPIKVIKDKFAKSLAISSCITYLLGIQDRHLDNLLIRGCQLFHVDYGHLVYLPSTTIMGEPQLRITESMIDLLGGVNSEHYNLFKNYTIKVFDILRLYTNIILNYYYILSHENIISWDDFKKRLTDRFMNGLSIKDVNITLINAIESSSTSYAGKIIDYVHDLSQKWSQN